MVGSVAQATWTGEPTTIAWLTYLSPYLRIAEFAAGGLLARFALVAPTERLPWLLPASLGVLAAFVVGFSLPGCPEWLYGLRVSGAYVIPAGLLIYYSYSHAPRWLEHPWIVFAGEISYSYYLFHVVTIVGVAKLWRGLGLPDAWPAMLALVLVVNFALAAALYLWWERPARQVIRAALASSRRDAESERGNKDPQLAAAHEA